MSDAEGIGAEKLREVLELVEGLTRTRELDSLVEGILDAATKLLGGERGCVILQLEGELGGERER